MGIIKRFIDGTSLEYGQGSFDGWCVYIKSIDGKRKAPRDIEYFNIMKSLSVKYSAKRIYSDFLLVYNKTSNKIEKDVLNMISDISISYNEDSTIVDKILSIIYMGMIAEERKEHTKLGKRIKRLGVYKLLVEDVDVYEAANCMRGMKWQDINDECIEAGF